MHEVTEHVLTERPTAVLRRRLEITEIEGWIGAALGRVMQVVADAGVVPAGPPFARYHAVAGSAATFDVEAGMPLMQPLPNGVAADVEPSRLPGGAAAVLVHAGPYEALMQAYEALDKWIAEQGAEPDGGPWESYLSAPDGDPRALRTEVVQPFVQR